MNFEQLVQDKQIVYESTVALDAPALLFKRQSPRKLVVADKTIYISGESPITIPFSDIEKISFSYLLSAIRTRVELTNGKVYKLLWYSGEPSFFPYSIFETQVLAMNLKKLVEGKVASITHNPHRTKSKAFLELFLIIFPILIGFKLAGVGGLLGGFIIVFGINRTIRNIDFSASKKIIYSVLYLVGGVVLALLVAFGLTYAMKTFWPQNISPKTISVRPPSGFSEYRNETLEVQNLFYPSGWETTFDQEQYMVTFEAPDTSRTILFGIVAVGEGETFETKTIADGVILSFKNEGMTIDSSKDETTEVNGQKALYTDIIFRNKTPDTLYERVIVFPTGRYGGRQYVYFIMNTDKGRRVSDMQILDTMVKSLKFSPEAMDNK